jgi:hypothetical protein
MITFRKSNNNSVERRAGAYWSSRKKTPYTIFLVVKGPAADATDAPQPWGLLCNLVMKVISFFVFPCNGTAVE